MKEPDDKDKKKQDDVEKDPKKDSKSKDKKKNSDNNGSGDVPDENTPRVQFVTPLYADALKGALVPIGGELLIQWKIEPNLSSQKKLVIALVKRGAYDTVYTINSNLTSKDTKFNWVVGEFEGGSKNLPRMSPVGDYRLYIFENGTKYTEVTGDLIPAGTTIFPFDPIDVRAEYKISHAASGVRLFSGTWVLICLSAYLI